MARPNCMIEQMFLDIASDDEMQTLKKSFYRNKNWGGAATYMLRKILPVWAELLNQKYSTAVHYSQADKYTTQHQNEEFEIPNLLS